MINKKILDHINTIKSLSKLKKEIDKVIQLIFLTIRSNKKILICGNGGSAADAQHLAAEFIVRLKSSYNRKALPIIPLALDSSTMTACGNDYGFENIFSRTFEALSAKGDLLIVLSTSGNSKNIIKVLKKAKQKKIKTVCFLGNKGGKSKKYGHQNIIVPSKDTAIIQESHIFLGHYIFEEVEKKIFKRNY
tara:strand:+ start:4845 stop:5417 length:573 start_codon:yes stop_codon:yes gene_type:complete